MSELGKSLKSQERADMYGINLPDIEKALTTGESNINESALRAGAVLCSLETGEIDDLYGTLEEIGKLNFPDSDEC